MSSTHLPPSIYMPELLQIIARDLPWSTLAHFISLPDPGPDVVARELRHRISSHLDCFIPVNDQDEFFRSLEGCGGIITGSFVRMLLQHGEDGPNTFQGSVTNLNIVVERFSMEPIADVLRHCGYWRREATVAPHFKLVACSFSKYVKGRTMTNDVPYVTLTVAEEGVLSVVLSSPTTADTTFLTANNLVSFYPRLLHANECMVITRREDPSAHVARLLSQGIRVVSNNPHWSKPCGVWCPTTYRKTFHDKGVRLLKWHDYRRMRPSKSTAWSWNDDDNWPNPSSGPVPVVENEAFLYRDNLQWSVWKECQNPHCPNCVLGEERSEVLGM